MRASAAAASWARMPSVPAGPATARTRERRNRPLIASSIHRLPALDSYMRWAASHRAAPGLAARGRRTWGRRCALAAAGAADLLAGGLCGLRHALEPAAPAAPRPQPPSALAESLLGTGQRAA